MTETFMISLEDFPMCSLLSILAAKKPLPPSMIDLEERLFETLGILRALGGKGRMDMYFTRSEMGVLKEVLETKIQNEPSPGEFPETTKAMSDLLIVQANLLIEVRAKLNHTEPPAVFHQKPAMA